MSFTILDLAQWALTHGIIMSGKKNVDEHVGKMSATYHAPFTLQPYSYPSSAFEKGKSLAVVFNKLIHAISSDSIWLLSALDTTAKNDPFTGKLMEIYQRVLAEKKSTSVQNEVKPEITLAVNRSDYMLHEVEGDSRNLLQVEINTIASSFGSLSTRISEMFRAFYAEEVAEPKPGPGLSSRPNIPKNLALYSISYGINLALKKYEELYGKDFSPSGSSTTAIVLMVVQPGERNFADQRHIHFELMEKFGIKCVRASLQEIYTHSVLSDSKSGELVYKGRRVGVVYFRAGYSPDDYISLTPTATTATTASVTTASTEDDCWAARLRIELSTAVKCPNIAYHLAGTKKVQQAIALPGVLERFLSDADEIAEVRSVFAGLFSLDAVEFDGGAQALQEVKRKALANPLHFVVKPQREGGGNNLYGKELSAALTGMSDAELSAYILMERIQPPNQRATLIREGVPNETDCLCELGIFGVYVSVSPPSSASVCKYASTTNVEQQDAGARTTSTTTSKEGGEDEDRVLLNQYAGHLLRVKPMSTDEGGVAAGYAVLSCPALV